MKPAYHLYSWLALALMLSLSACQKAPHERKQIDRRISLWRKDKIPYGTKVAFDELAQLFPNSVIEINPNDKKPFATSTTDGKKAYIFIGKVVDATPEGLSSIMNFVENGNHVFFSALYFSDTLLHTLGLSVGDNRWSFKDMDSMSLSVLDPEVNLYRNYTYPGDKYETWFRKVDSQYAQVIGKDDFGRANMIRITYKSGGSICLQCAPIAFSNFFLLHKQNREYYERALSYLPSSVSEVIWDDHFRYGESESFSAFRYILGGGAKTRPLAWALGLLCLLFLLLYTFNAKRRQRMIPRIEPLRNSSVDFVRTIGRLYFQRRDNQNLAMKMTAHFLDHVRTRWRMPTTELNESFAESLAYRSGYPREKLNDLLDRIYHLPLMTGMSDEELMDFHYQLEAFYKQA